MYCNKCNSQVPDGAKFCPNCGALTAPKTENKNFCENCGLELPKGAKFCTVCGAAVTKMSSAEVKPSDVLAPVTPSEPVSIAPAVDLAKTTDESVNTVAAVTVNTESAYSIPIPTSDISMPSVGAAPVEEPAAVIPEPVPAPSSFEENGLGFIPEAPVITETPVTPEPVGYSAAAASYAAPTAMPSPAPTAAPAYASNPNNQMENPFGDFGTSAAAVAAKPIKKKSVLKPILIAVGSLIVAVLIAAGVLFFVNKSLLFNIVLGNSGYAAMVEGNSIKDVTNKLDVGAMSEGIKSATSSYANVLTQMSNYSSGITTTSVKPMMSSSMSNIGSVDFKTLVNQLGDIMREAYGANSANISMDFNAELTDTGLAQLAGAMNCTQKEVKEILDLINGSGFSIDVTADGKALETSMEMTGGSLKLNAKTVITEDGNVYLVLPFVSEKAFMIKIGSGYTASAGQVSDVYLEIDEKELKKIIENLVNVYVDVYKSSEITVKDGEISIAGATAKGKYITANLTGKKISEMIKRMGESLANNSYLCGQFAKFLSDCGLPVSAEQVKSTLNSLSGMLEGRDIGIDLVIETVTDNSCRVLGKSYSVTASGKTIKVSAVGDFNITTKNGNTAAIAAEIDGQTIASALVEKSSDTDGVCTVTVYTEGTSVSAKVKYTCVRETTFNGKPTVEGTYEISMVLPADFTQAGGSDAAAAIVSSAKIVFSVKVENDSTVKETLSFEIPQYGKLSANAALTTADKPNGITIPSDVLDITEAAMSGSDEIPEDLKKDVISYLKDMRNAVKNQNAGEIGNKLSDSLEQLIDLAENGPSADTYEIGDLMIAISNEKSEVMMFDEQYQNEDETLSEKSEALVKKYDVLLTAISEKNFKMTEKEFDSFNNSLAILTAEKDALQKEYEAANSQIPNIGFTSKAEEIDFSSLDFNSLSLIFAEYAMRYEAVLQQNSNLFEKNYELKALANEAASVYETAIEDFDNLYDVYQAGSLNLSLLRKARKSTNTFALAVEALEKAAATSI